MAKNPALKEISVQRRKSSSMLKKDISDILLKPTSFSTTKILMKPSSPSEPNPSLQGDMLPHHHRLKPPPPHDVESEVVYSDDGYLWTRILREVFRTAISAGFGVLRRWRIITEMEVCHLYGETYRNIPTRVSKEVSNYTLVSWFISPT